MSADWGGRERSFLCRRKVVEAAAQRAQATAEWLDSHEFMPEAELSSWEDVVGPQTDPLLCHGLSKVATMLSLVLQPQGLQNSLTAERRLSERQKASQGVRAQVHWAKDDPEGRPVLIVHLKAALRQDAAGAKRAAEAILTHMECVLQQRLRDDLGGPEQVVVVLDSRGAPTLQARRLCFWQPVSQGPDAMHVCHRPSGLEPVLLYSVRSSPHFVI